MINKHLISEEIKRFNQIVNHNKIINESIGSFTDDILKGVIKRTIVNSIKNSTDNAIKNALKQIRTSGIDALPINTSNFKKNLRDNVTKELKKLPQASSVNFDDNFYKMAITRQIDVVINQENKNITKGFREAAEKQAKKAGKEAGEKVVSTTSKDAGGKIVSPKPDTDDFVKISQKGGKEAGGNVVSRFKPGGFVGNGSFKDELINWDNVTNAKNMTEYNKIIASALESGNYNFISRGGFEKYGIPDFRDFLIKNVDKSENILTIPRLGVFNFKIKKTPISVSGLGDKIVSQLPEPKPGQWSAGMESAYKESANELRRRNPQILNQTIEASKNLKNPKNKRMFLDGLEKLGILTIKDGKRKISKTSLFLGIGGGILLSSWLLGGGATEEGIEVEAPDAIKDDAKKFEEKIQKERNWRLQDPEFGRRLKKVLGKSPEEQFTDQDIDDIYKKLTDLKVIQ